MPGSAAELHAAGQERSARTLILARREWDAAGEPGDVDMERIARVLAASMVGAAQDGAASVGADLIESGFDVAPDGMVVPAAFGLAASDGRPLLSLIGRAVTIARDYGMSTGRVSLDRIVHTQVQDAARAASSVAVAARPRVGWVRFVKPPCCQDCAVLAGKWFRWNQGFKRHPNCFPAGVITSGPRVEAATRRQYDGELVVLSTASGQELPVTGNHPVLTRRGWVPANLIEEGDEVFRSTRPEGASALMVPHHDQMPARIEDVWRALSMGGLHPVESSAEDFHGDGQHGQVDVVWADCALCDRALTARRHEIVQHAFTGRRGSPERFSTQCRTELLNGWCATHPRRPVGSRGLALALLGSHAGVTGLPGLGLVAPLDPGLYQPLGNNTARYAVLHGQGVFASTRAVCRDDLGHGEVENRARWDAPRGAFSGEAREGYARQGRDVLNRLSGQVEPDRVVKLVRREFRGHVYSLTSSEGWHSANNLIVSNCDCVHRPAHEDEPPSGYAQDVDPDQIHDLTQGQRSALREGADLGRVVNAYRRNDGRMWSAGERQKKLTAREIAGRGERLTPDGIFGRAKSREEAVRLLTTHGYLAT